MESWINQELLLINEEIFTHFTTKELNELARKTQFVVRKRKMGAKESILLLIWMGEHIGKASLHSLCSRFTDITNISITPEGLNQRFNSKMVQFLYALLKRLLATKVTQTLGSFTMYRSIFQRIRILDSTAFQIPDKFSAVFPGTGCTSVKFQIELDVLSGQFTHAHFEAGRIHDACTATHLKDTIQSTDLILRDLGYFNLRELQEMTDNQNGYFISRLKGNTKIYRKNPHPTYWKNGKVIQKTMYIPSSIEELVQTIPKGTSKEFEDIYIGKQKTKLPVRFIIHHFSASQLRAREARLKEIERVKGIRYTENTKKMQAYGLYITNLPIEIPTEQIYPLYSIRWQIELLFKAWKSFCQLTACKPMKIERLLCHFYAQMITMMICTMVTYRMRYLVWLKQKRYQTSEHFREISELKSFLLVKKSLFHLYLAIQKNTRQVLKQLILLLQCLERNGTKSRKKGKPTFQQLIGVLD